MSAPACYRLCLAFAQEDAEKAATLLSEHLVPAPDAVGFFETRDSGWQVEAWFPEKPDLTAIAGCLQAGDLPAPEIAVEAVETQDWVALSQEGLHPVRAGRFIIHGSHDRQIAARSRYAIEIDAAQAFGTAHHATTQGCLEALDGLAKARRFSRVLDIGTGTGILAIAAAKLWRRQILATDMDPVSCAIAADNARANSVAHCVRTLAANGAAHPGIRARAPYDLVIANILARPLVALAPDFAALVSMGGVVILSGIMRHQAAGVAAAYRSHGFVMRNTLTADGWATLVIQRRPWIAIR